MINRRGPWPLFFATLFFMGLALLLFRGLNAENQIFSASDANLGWLTFKKGYMPEMFTGAFRAFPVLGKTSLKLPCFSEVLLWIFPAQFYNNWIYAFFLVGASLFFMLYLRLLNRSWFASMIGAVVAFWVGSVTLASAGHVGKFGVAFFGVASLFLIEKAIRTSGWRRWSWAVLSGGAVGFMLLEQQDVALLWGMLLAPYALFRAGMAFGKSDRMAYVQLFIPIVVVGILLSIYSSLQVYRANISDTAAAQNKTATTELEKWNYMTQWSFPPSDLIDVVAPGFKGWKSNDSTGPYWGQVGQSANWNVTQKGFRNFKLDSLYIGIIPLLAAIYAFLRRKKEDRVLLLFFSLMAVLFLFLSFGRHTPIYRLFYALPLFNNIRNPVKFMQLFQLVVGVLAAFGVDQFIERLNVQENRIKFPRMLQVLIGLCAAFIFSAILIVGTKSTWAELFRNDGWSDENAIVMVENMVRALFHSGILIGLSAGFIFWATRVDLVRKVLPWLLMVLLATDAWMLSRHYYHFESIEGFASNDAVLSFLEENTGDERVFLFDASGVHNRWVGVDFRYRGINNFNIFQMPRMANDYKHWLTTVQENIFRLTELSAVKYISFPVHVWKQAQPSMRKRFKPVLFYGFTKANAGYVAVKVDATRASHVLVEDLLVSPRISVKNNWQFVEDTDACNVLKSPRFSPASQVVVSSDAQGTIPFPVGRGAVSVEEVHLDNRKAIASVRLENPGIVLFSQKYASDWNVYVDGQKSPLLRCNYLCIGTWVDAGRHTVEFVYNPSGGELPYRATGSLLLLVAGVSLLIPRFIKMQKV